MQNFWTPKLFYSYDKFHDTFDTNFHATGDLHFHRHFIYSCLTVCNRSLSKGRAAVLVDFVLRTDTKLTSLGPDTILGMVFDLTNRYSSPGCLLLFLNVPHNMFLMSSRLSYRNLRSPPASSKRDRMCSNYRTSPRPKYFVKIAIYLKYNGPLANIVYRLNHYGCYLSDYWAL